MTDNLGPAFVFGLIVMMFQDWLKRFNWYGTFVRNFPAADKYVQKMIAAVFSLVAAVGVTLSAHGSLTTGGQITIAYPEAHVMAAGVWNFVVTYVAQNFAYRSTRESVLTERT